MNPKSREKSRRNRIVKFVPKTRSRCKLCGSSGVVQIYSKVWKKGGVKTAVNCIECKPDKYNPVIEDAKHGVKK
jgi:transcription elongation factor Elf1